MRRICIFRGANWSEGSPRILKRTFDVIVFMWVHWHCREIGCKVCWITMFFWMCLRRHWFQNTSIGADPVWELNRGWPRLRTWVFNSWVFNSWNIFANFEFCEPKTTFFREKRPYVAPYERWGGLVGWLGLWATFRHVCHGKKIGVPLVPLCLRVEFLLKTYSGYLFCLFVLFVNLFVYWNQTRKTTLCLLSWEGSKPPGCEHTRAEAPTTCVPRQRHRPRTCQFMVNTPQVDELARINGLSFLLSFFLSWVSKTQPNHWT